MQRRQGRKEVGREAPIWFQGRLLRWFEINHRDLPWRKTRDPYKILVSEIMLQQTQVDRVIPKYRAFLKEFPTSDALARASTSAVIRAWSGLGYNRRALYLQRAADVMWRSREWIASVPTAKEGEDVIAALEKLPGVGKYTARAIAAFAFGHDVAAVDTNVARVIHRWLYGVEKPKRKASPRAIQARADALVPDGKGWTWNHALMDFGAAVCTAKRPRCMSCPMRARCAAYPEVLAVTNGKLKTRGRRADRFLGSNRYWRGRVIELLRHATAHSLTLSQIIPLLGSGMTPQLLRPLVVGLVKDRLLVLQRSRIALPK